MSRRGGKGRVSNDLVAASCAAILTVYAAGYLRTRDVARRMEARAQERRPTPAAVPAEPSPPVPSPAPASPEVTAVVEPPPPKPARQPAKPARKTPSKVAAAPRPAAQPQPVAAAAAPTVVPVPEPQAVPAQRWRDGTYTGWGQSYHGDIEAKVVIRDGRIVEANIATCATRYPCYVIERIIDQPVKRQSHEVDRVSAATESSDAYFDGLKEALNKALEADAPAAPSP